MLPLLHKIWCASCSTVHGKRFSHRKSMLRCRLILLILDFSSPLHHLVCPAPSSSSVPSFNLRLLHQHRQVHADAPVIGPFICFSSPPRNKGPCFLAHFLHDPFDPMRVARSSPQPSADWTTRRPLPPSNSSIGPP
ncbi:hypothetical protein CC79DRAFT_6115 [Sarocladium strictum]